MMRYNYPTEITTMLTKDREHTLRGDDILIDQYFVDQYSKYPQTTLVPNQVAEHAETSADAVALVHGAVERLKGTITAAIARDPVRRTRMTTRPSENARAGS